MDTSKYTQLIKLVPKVIWTFAGICMCILAIGIAVREAKQGDLTAYLFHKDKQIQVSQIELEKAKVEASDDYTPSEKMLLGQKYDKLIKLIGEKKDLQEEVNQSYGFFEKKLVWDKDRLGRYSKFNMIITDWHLLDVPFPDPKTFMERWFDYLVLLYRCIIEESHNEKINDNISLMQKLNLENIDFYKDGLPQ